MAWEKGCQLKQFTKADGTVIQYTYNANGIRTSKTVDGVLHTYQLDGTKILKETWGDCTLIPLYDNENSVCGIIYNGSAYYFYKNLQGDIIEIANKVGTIVARYTYDAWGKVTAITDGTGVDISNNVGHVANANPFRYRGYYYDAEIGMYYLQSRYYDPNVGRYINADSLELITTLASTSPVVFNFFAYCVNNPVNHVDYSGYLGFWVNLIIILSAGITGVFIKIWNTVNSQEYKNSTPVGKRIMIIYAIVIGFFQGAGTACLALLIKWGWLLGLINGILSAAIYIYGFSNTDKSKKKWKYFKASKLLNEFMNGFTQGTLSALVGTFISSPNEGIKMVIDGLVSLIFMILG